MLFHMITLAKIHFLIKGVLWRQEVLCYTDFRSVTLNGYGFSRPFRLMRIESPPGQGLAERIRMSVNKKENTWCDASVDSRSRIKYSPVFCATRTRWTVSRMTCRTNTDSDGNPNVFELERYDDGLWLNDHWAKPDNERNPNNKFVFRLRNSFLFRGLHVAVFLFGIAEIFLPTAEHLTRFLELQRNVFAVFVGNELAFPCYRNEEFKRV